MSDEKGVGGLPDAGTIKPGAPGHIEDHDEMSRLMQVAADTLGITLDPPPPPPAVIGEYGHVDAHNTLLANIEQLAEAGGGGLPGELPGVGGWADVTVVTGVGTKYSYTADGMDWSAFEWYDWTSKNAQQTGTITTSGGIVDCLVVSSGVAHNYAACAPVTDAELVFPAGILNLSMGYALGATVDGSYSDTRITPDGTTDLQRQIVINSGYTAYFDGNVGRSPNGQYSSITGTEVLYGHCPDPWPAGANPPGWGGISGSNTPGAVIVRVPATSDKTGMAAGAFDTRTLRDKAKQAAKDKAKEKIRDKHTSPVTQEID